MARIMILSDQTMTLFEKMSCPITPTTPVILKVLRACRRLLIVRALRLLFRAWSIRRINRRRRLRRQRSRSSFITNRRDCNEMNALPLSLPPPLRTDLRPHPRSLHPIFLLKYPRPPFQRKPNPRQSTHPFPQRSLRSLWPPVVPPRRRLQPLPSLRSSRMPRIRIQLPHLSLVLASCSSGARTMALSFVRRPLLSTFR